LRVRARAAAQNGQVIMAEDGTVTTFRRSSHCSGGSCIEVGFLPDGRVALRDTRSSLRRHLTFTECAWASFLDAVRRGRFRR
jgi:hypothetical protein